MKKYVALQFIVSNLHYDIPSEKEKEWSMSASQ